MKNSMKNKKIKVIHSCDDNPYYLDFWPLVSRVWKERIGYDPVLIHIGTKSVSSEYGEVIKINPIEHHDVYIQTQLSRLWYPQFEPDVLWITSDIDMFPISKTYWKENINDDYNWCNLNTNLKNYFPICYNVATGENFKKILKINESFDEFIFHVIEKYKKQTKIHKPENWNEKEFNMWGLDEYFISDVVSSYRDNGGNVYQPLRLDGFHDGRRINRTEVYDVEKIKNNWYIDCHSLRPYEKYKTQIDDLLNHLL